MRGALGIAVIMCAGCLGGSGELQTGAPGAGVAGAGGVGVVDGAGGGAGAGGRRVPPPLGGAGKSGSGAAGASGAAGGVAGAPGAGGAAGSAGAGAAGTTGTAGASGAGSAGTAGTAGTAGGTAALTPAEADLLRALNDERGRQGLAPVAIDERLLCAARKHAMDVGGNGSCGHVGSDGTWPWDRAMTCGFPQSDWTVNEIAAGPGFTDGNDAVDGWRQSPGHYRAIVLPEARTVGVAVYQSCYIALFDCCVAMGG